MTAERPNEALSQTRVMEQLRTPWGPLNKRTSQDVLARIGQETGQFKVPQILTFDEAADKSKKVLSALVFDQEKLPLMRTFLHNPVTDNVLCGFLDTKGMISKWDYFRFYKELLQQYSQLEPSAGIYLRQMGFPSEKVGSFGVFFQEQIGGDRRFRLSVLDTVDGAYVELVPRFNQFDKSGFIFRENKLYCQIGPEYEIDTPVYLDTAFFPEMARDCYFRHLLIGERFYQGKPRGGRFPLITEWVCDQPNDEWYAVQLRASLVEKPYSFRLMTNSRPGMSWTNADRLQSTTKIKLGSPVDETNKLIAKNKSGYCLHVEDLLKIPQTPLGIIYGKPGSVEFYDYKAVALADHNLFGVMQVTHALGADTIIRDTEDDMVKFKVF